MSSNIRMTRRSLLAGANLLGAGMWAAPVLSVTEADLFPVATTTHGKIKGISWTQEMWREVGTGEQGSG